MRPIHAIAALVLVALGFMGCSTQPGGSEDPPEFKPGLTAPEAAASLPTPSLDSEHLARLELDLRLALERIERLEQSLSGMQETLASIEQTAQAAMNRAEQGPLAGVDASDDQQVGQALMRQSLEQIIGISRLLLDKMEQKVEGMAPAGPGAHNQ